MDYVDSMNHNQILIQAAETLGLTSARSTPPFSGILVAWSGGLDSTVLLHALRQLARIHGFELFAVHIDHTLRPDSAADAAWCQRQATRLGIGLHIEKLTIRPGSSTQNQARAQRYAALFNTAHNLQLPLLATAHHADDAVETALLNFARGTSLKGLVSLSTDTPIALSTQNQLTAPAEHTHFSKAPSDISLMRPLLHCSRAELEAYAAHHQLTWRTDPSNATDHYDRNHIRHHVIPELTRKTNSTAQLQRSLEHLRQDSDALDQLAKILLQQALRPSALLQTIELDRQRIASAPSAIITRVLTLSHPGWNHTTLDAALSILSSNKTLRISLTGATATFRHDTILIEPTIGRGARELDQRTAHPAHLDIRTSGEIHWFDTILTWQRFTRRPDQSESQSFSLDTPHLTHFDADQLPPKLILRGPRGNERIQTEAPTGRKRLKDIWHEHAIPADIRWRWPCLTAATPDQHEDILWVCNLRRSHLYKITPHTHTILTISCTPPLPAKKHHY